MSNGVDRPWGERASVAVYDQAVDRRVQIQMDDTIRLAEELDAVTEERAGIKTLFGPEDPYPARTART